MISTSVSETVEKIPTNNKDYRKCPFLYFTLHTHSTERADQHIVNIRNSCLPTRIHPVQLKNTTEDILHKIYREKGAITGIRLVLSTVEVRKEFTGFQMATSQLMLGRRRRVMWVHSNSLIKNSTPFEDDAEILLLNFLMQSICKQPEDTFINMASLKINFYFEVFK